MTRDEKSALISELTEGFSNAEGIVVGEFKGLIVKKIEELRQLAKEKDIKVQVIKNTLASIALKNANKEGIELKDSNIFIWGDQLNVSKVAVKFEENNEKFIIKTAHFEGEVCDVEKVKALSKMPSREELLAMLLQVWNAPIQNFTIGLNALKVKKEEIA